MLSTIGMKTSDAQCRSVHRRGDGDDGQRDAADVDVDPALRSVCVSADRA